MPTTARRSPVLALLTAALAVGVVADPLGTLNAARQGLGLWWTAVLPSLLPFFILNDLLRTLGVVRALGTLLDPAMRPLFHLPGAAGFGLAVGFTSGYPAGARAAATLTEAGLCTGDEGSHLAAFTNAAGPLFITGVTAVSLFRCPAAALPLALAHYGSAVLCGMVLARWPSPLPGSPRRPATQRRRAGPLAQVWRELEDGATSAPPLGHLLGAVVREAGTSVLLIGGFVVLFSVLLGLAERSGLLGMVAAPLARLASACGLPPELARPLTAGLLEVTNGLSLLAKAPGSLRLRLALASGLLAWSGLSVHAQAAAVSASAKLSYRRFLAARILQVVLSPVLFLALWPLAAGPAVQVAVPAGPPEPLAHVKAGTIVFLLSLVTLGAVGAGLAAAGWLQRRLSRRVSAIWGPRTPRRPS